MKKRHFLQENKRQYWLHFVIAFFAVLTFHGCDATSGWFVLILVFGLVGYVASKTSKVSKKERNIPSSTGNQQSRIYKTTNDHSEGVQVRVTTWAERANAQAGKWVLSIDPIDIKGISVPRPMFYMGRIPKGSYPDPCLINPSLPVSKKIKGGIESLGYWPSYTDMTPDQRRAYIDWLADGRKDPTIDIGYVFVFFYGLERRLIMDRKNDRVILSELRRLRSIYDNRSFQNYSSNLMTFNIVKNLDRIPANVLPDAFPTSFGGRGYSEETVNAILSWYIVNQKPLPSNWALVAAENDPRSPSSVITKRVKTEFEKLFNQRYEEQFGEGIMLKSSKRPRIFTYHPASSSLSSLYSQDGAEDLFRTTLPNPLGITSQFKPLVEIRSKCIEDLKAFSRQQAKSANDEPLTAEAWEKLPAELRAQFDHPESGLWSKILDDHMEDGSVAWVPVKELAAIKEIPVREKLTAGQSTKIAETAANLGYGVEPDARLTRRGYGWGEKIAIYHDPEPNEHLNAVSSFSAASVMLQLSLSVASADGVLSPEELETVTEFLNNRFNLSDSERKRLTICGNRLMQSKISLAGIGKQIQAHLDEKERQKVGRFLVAVAAADGIFEKSEIAAIKNAYKAMGMDPKDAIAEIDKVKATLEDSDEPVLIQKGRTTEAGEPIPPPPDESEPTGAVRLNSDAIARILDDTKDVSQMLGAVLSENDETTDSSTLPMNSKQHLAQKPPSDNTVVVPRQKKSVNRGVKQPQSAKGKISLASLSPKYRPFLKELLRQSHWNESEFRALAGKHTLMVNGAIDAVNEWSEDEFGDFLIDCDTPYTIHKKLLKR